jgi:uncharacterized protein
MRLHIDDPLVRSVRQAIERGDIDAVRSALAQHPGLATARIYKDSGYSRTVLHEVSDWPGQFPNAPAMARMLVEAGADVDAVTQASFAETPLHGAASTDDLELAEALIDLGANLEASGGSIAGGTPLDNAVGYACWAVARLLVQRGARVNKLWHASAMGMLALVRELMDTDPPPTQETINQAFWHACSGGQRRTAEYLLGRGADINFVPEYANVTPLAAATSVETRRDTLASWLRDRGAT